MSRSLNNPKSVVWSHSNSQADFYEFPTDGTELHSMLGFLLKHYDEVKLWMGVESDDGAELYMTCTPSRRHEVVNRIKVYEEQMPLFEVPAVAS